MCRNPEDLSLDFDDPTPLRERQGKTGGYREHANANGPIIVAVGMSDVGKMCTLRGIGHDREVTRHFTGGVLMDVCRPGCD